ncbi:MAG: TonB-dependent receptor [Bacteroidales bacterium]|jgi:TonB-linked SusC/RagA family outer membrane protein|nr:TonB-dependent receptor [Bacteroidales bacterium]
MKLFVKHSIFKQVRFITLVSVFALIRILSVAGPLPETRQSAQSIVVTGAVTDQGEPLPGVNVIVKGTTIGVVTDASGRYSITVPDKDAVLQFSFMGYITSESVVGDRRSIDVSLVEETREIEEVVVVGYGVQKRVNVVGAVTTLKGEEIRAIPAASAAAAMSGRLPGVTVIQTSGEPGVDGSMAPRMYVRGRSTLGVDNDNAKDIAKTIPLVIIDGVQGRSIGEIDPNDIASFSVLKDASAAIYGAQAANGVILITTKSGQAGKSKLNFSFYQGFMTPSRTPELCDAAEYAAMLSEYQDYNGSSRTYNDRDIELFASGEDPWEHPNTDWYGELIKKWTTTTRYNLTMDGGFKGMTYLVSLGFKQDDAMYKQSSTKYNQFNIRTKVSIPITDWLSTDINIAGFKTRKLFPYRGAGDMIGAATRTHPTSPAYWPTGEPAPDIENGDNPVVTSSFAGGKNEQDTYRLQNNLKVTVALPFVDGLSFSASLDYDLNNFYRKRFFQSWYLYYPEYAKAVRDPDTGFITEMPLTPSLRGPVGAVLPSLQNDFNRTINITSKVDANYIQSFGFHDVSLYAGFEQYTSDYNEFWAQREKYVSTLVQILNVGPDLNKTNSGRETVYARRSWIGRATYAYKSKYLAEVVFRADASLKFPKENRWGYFPGFLLGWRASEEGFWKDNLSFINYFKLKASYGEMGMDPGDPFQYIDKYSLGTVTGMVFGTNGVIDATTGPPTVANRKITWERQKTKNIGVESQFLNGLLFLNFDYFYNIRDQILAPKSGSVPDYTGITLPDENMARVDNQGFEMEAGVRKSYRDWHFGLSGNFSLSRNKLVFIDEVDPPVPWQAKTGLPWGTRLMYEAAGIFRDKEQADAYAKWGTVQPQEGDVIFKNVSAGYADLDPDYDDNAVNANDRVLVEHTVAPDIFYGVNIDLSWKNFTFSALLQGQGEFLKKNYSDDRRGEEGNYFKFMYTDRWTPDHRDASMPRAWSRSNQYWISNENTFWWDNCAYFRLKNVVLSYSIPNQYYKAIGISSINVYFSGNNLAYLWSGTKKFDPETDGANSYPTMRTLAIGANITF